MEFKEALDNTVSSWMGKEGPEDDIVLGTRVRLARNMAKIPFPATAKKEQLDQVVKASESLVDELKQLGEFTFLRMAEVESLERALLVEKHLISPNHTRNPHFKGLLLKKEQDVSIMINEEDHIRIQVLFPGLQLEKASTLAETFDDAFEARIPYAYDQEYGYLTACPTNVGTGMRASVMVHLPALVRVNRVKQVLGPISKFGLVVRGLYGEGSEAHGNIYQISNQISLGHKEEEIMAHLLSITSKVINGERQAREYLMQPERRLNVEDHVYRAYGLLAHARTIGTEEALGLLSQLRLGIDLGLVKSFDKNILKQLMVLIRAAHLQKVMGQNLPEEERDRLRASLIREKMKS